MPTSISYEFNQASGTHQSNCCAAISLDRKLIATYDHNGHKIRICSTMNKTVLYVLTIHQDTVSNLAFFPDNKHLVSASFDGTAKISNVESGRVIQTIELGENDVTSVTVSPCGGTVALGTMYGQAMLLLPGNTDPHAIMGDECDDSVISMVYSCDGNMLFCGHDSGKLSAFDLQTLELKYEKRHHTDTVNKIVISRDSATMVTVGDDEATIVIDCFTGAQILNVNMLKQPLTAVSISASGKYIAVGSSFGAIAIVQVGTDKMYTFRGEHRPAVIDLEFSPDDPILIGCSNTRPVVSWKWK